MRVAPANHEDLLTPAIKDQVRSGATLFSSHWTCRCTLSADSREPADPPSPTLSLSWASQGSRRFGQAPDVRHLATARSFLRAACSPREKGASFNMEMYTNVLLVTANVGSLFENVSSPDQQRVEIKAAPGCNACQRIILNTSRLKERRRKKLRRQGKG